MPSSPEKSRRKCRGSGDNESSRSSSRNNSYTRSVGSATSSVSKKSIVESMPALPMSSPTKKKTSSQTSDGPPEIAALESPRRLEKASPAALHDLEFPLTESSPSPGGESEQIAQAAPLSPCTSHTNQKATSGRTGSHTITMEDAVLQAMSSLSSSPQHKKKSSPRRRKHGGLGAFLSKYDDKEQQQHGKKGLNSSSASYTGSIGSESTGSKKSIASMPGRLPLMFSRSGRSDTKETTAASTTTKCSTSPKRGVKQTHSSQDKSTSGSASPSKSPLRTASPTRKALQTAPSWGRGPARSSPTRCTSYDGCVAKPASQGGGGESGLSASNHETGISKTSLRTLPSMLSPSPSPSSAVHPRLNRGGLVKTPSLRMNGNFGIDQELGDQVVASYEKLISEFDQVDDHGNHHGNHHGKHHGDVLLSAARTCTERTTQFPALSGRAEGVRKALPGPPLLAHATVSVDRSTSEKESLQKDRPDSVRRQVNRNASEEISSRVVRSPEGRRQCNRSTSEDSLSCAAFLRAPQEKRQPVNRNHSTPEEMITAYHTILSEFNDSSDMDTLLAYTSCSSLHVDNLLLLNSCNSMDVSNSFVAGLSVSTMGDLNQVLDMNSCSSGLDASFSSDIGVVPERKHDNIETATTTTAVENNNISNNDNTRRTTAKPVPVTFRKPRPAIPKHGNDGGGDAIASIPIRTGKLEFKMMTQKLDDDDDDDGCDDDDDDDSPVATNSNRLAITKKSSLASTTTTVDWRTSPSPSPTSTCTGNNDPSSLWTGDDDEAEYRRGSQYCDEQHVDIVWDGVQVLSQN